MSNQNQDGVVTTERTGPNEVTIVVVTPSGANAHPIQGGLTEDDLLE
jgi:hypothetical protein